MGQDAEELRREIARTRSDLSGTLDAIGDRVSPGRMMDRRKNRMALGLRSMKERVMGTATDAGERVSGTAHHVSETAHHVPDAMRERTEGAPMVAGALAFGIGFLAAAGVPPTRTERELSEPLRERIEPIKNELTDAAHEVADHLREPAKEALQGVKGAAAEGARHVESTAADKATEVKDSVARSR